MKKLLPVLLIILTLLSSCAPQSGKGELSKGITYLREHRVIQKRVSLAEPTLFSREEFESALGEPLSYIVISELPDKASGVVTLKGKPIVSGQTVPADAIDNIMFSPCGTEGSTAALKFYCPGGNYGGKEIQCLLTLSSASSLPTAASIQTDAIAGIPREISLSKDMSCRIVTYPSHGTLKLSSFGAVYTADLEYCGTDIFTYETADAYGNVSQTANVLISVSENKNRVVFEDIRENALHHDAARMCIGGIMTYRLTDGKYYFDPSKQISRIDFLVMLMDACECGNIYSVTDTVFADDSGLSTGRLSYLAKAVELGLTDVGNGFFRPTDMVTRAEAAVMLDRALALPELGKADAFADLASVPTDSAPSVCKVIKYGMMQLSKGYFYPASPLTKADCAAMLSKASEWKRASA